MSAGNLKTYGAKGKNFPFQQSLLLINDAIAQAVAGSATEATLISVLNAIVASDQDIEILLVRDEAVGNGNPVLKQVTNYETGTPVITYENVDGTTYVPAPNPVPVYVYLDPSAVLNLALAELITLNAGGQLSTEVTSAAILTAVNTLSASTSRSVSSTEHVAPGVQGTTPGISGVLITCTTGLESIEGIIRPVGIYTFEPQKGEDTLASISMNANGGRLIVDEIS